MAYTYCSNCDAGLHTPTFAESMSMVIECPTCGHDHELRHNEATDALISLEERITAIETQLGIKS